MIKKLLFYFIFLGFFSLVVAQSEGNFSLGLESNMQYYIDDAVTGDFLYTDPFRSNNYLKADYAIDKFTIGLQLEGYAPQSLLNYSPNLNDPINVGLYYAQYKSDKLDISAGHFYEQYGNGLILRSWEDRQLGINNAIRGIKTIYRPSENMRFSALYGNQRLGFDVSEGSLLGFDFGLDFPQLFQSESTSGSIGFSYVGRHQTIENNAPTFDPWTHAFSTRYQLNFSNFYTGGEVVLKSKDVLVQNNTIFEDKLFYGNALQLNAGYSQKGFGINTTFRRLENMSFFSERQAAGNTYNELIVNYLPALTKQHDYSLSNMYVYQAQPSLNFIPLEKAGEIGGQIDLYYQLKKGSALGGKYGTKVAVNYATWYGLGADFNADYQRVDVPFLKLGTHYFSDLSFEIRKKLSSSVSSIFTYIHGNYNKKYIEETSGFVRSDIGIAESTFKLNDLSSIRWELSHLWTKDDKKNWASSTLEWNANTHFSIFATDLYNYGNEVASHRNHYYLFGGSYTKNKTRIALNYGRQRGGILCVGGVCREVPAATGLTLNFTSSI